MKIPFFFRLLLLSAILAGCSGASDEPVSLQVPFSGALTDDSRVVVLDGASLSGGNPVEPGCTSFPGTDDNGNAVECQYCQNTEPVVSTDLVAPISGRRDHFNMLVRCLDNGGDIVTAEVEVFDYPHQDDTINISSLCPPGESCELRSGIFSGLFQFGTEAPLTEASADGLMTVKYVAVSKLEGGIKTYFHLNKGVSVIDGLGAGTMMAEPRNPGDLGNILPTLFENQPNEFHIENGFGWALFKQGDVENKSPAGFVEFTFSEPPPVATPDGIHLFLDGLVCRGDNCQCDLCTEEEKKNGCDDGQKVQQCHDNPATPFECENLSCVKVTHLEKFLHPIEEKNSLFTDGKPFSVAGTKHDPIVCETDTTGDYFNECMEARAQGRIMKLNYRCEIIAIFDAMGNFVDLSRSLAGSFVFSIEQP